MIEGKYILHGVSSSIACYKAVELARLFLKAEAEVRVIMTENATKMVQPIQFEALTGNPVYVDVFSNRNQWQVEHVVASKWGDVLIVAPATANILAKMAHGIADDALTTMYLAFPGKTFVAPAMHQEMWKHPATMRNIDILKERGTVIIGPEKGDLASGDEGVGRMSDPQKIFDIIKEFFESAESQRE